MVVLDTNVLAEILRVQPDAAVLDWLGAVPDAVATTAVTVAELEYGIQRLPAGRRRTALQERVQRLFDHRNGPMVLALDDAAARAAGRCRARRASAGRPSTFADSAIAGICLTHGAQLATRNTRDFVGLDMDLVDPWNLVH